MCAYFLGKNAPGDLASVLSGAYSSSSPAASVPAPAAQPTTPPNQTTTTTSGGTDKGPKCFQKCRAIYKDTGTQEFDICFDQCMADQDPGGTICDATHPCVTGECIDGHCVITHEPNCDATHPCTPPKVCTQGVCVDPNKPCNPPCVPPKVCENGVCVDKAASCPEGSGGTALDGCPCGTLYNTKTGKCASGYKFVKRPNNGVRDDWAKEIAPIPGAVGTCECEKWITPGTNKGKLGEYKYPPEMQALMDLLLSRGKEFMGLTPGYSQEAQDKMFGRGFENVRGQETGQRQALESGLSRQGMLGTGAGQGMLNDLSWQTEGNVANLARDLFIGNEEKKKQDLLDYTTAAQSVLGGGMGYAQLLEAINSARRGEGSSALQALLAWLLAQQ